MRIFYACDSSPNSALPSSRLWHVNLFMPLEDLGHELVTFDYDLTAHSPFLDGSSAKARAFIAEHRPRLEEALVEQVKRAHAQKPIDLFFSYFYSAMCRPAAIQEIAALGIPTMNWYCNASYQFHLVEELAPAYDFCLVPEKFRLDDYRRVGANPIYVQEAANPTVYRPMPVEQRYDISFCGQRYGDRPAFVARLLEKGLPVHVFGPGWEDYEERRDSVAGRLRRLIRDDGPRPVVGPPLSDEAMVRLYSESRISLGFSSCGETHKNERILQVRLRDFEAPMSGAFYMVEYMEELTEFFEPDREMVFYRDADDLADKARWYLDHPEERERIRQAGHRRAMAEHTWHERFRKAFAAAGLPRT